MGWFVTWLSGRSRPDKRHWKFAASRRVSVYNYSATGDIKFFEQVLLLISALLHRDNLWTLFFTYQNRINFAYNYYHYYYFKQLWVLSSALLQWDNLQTLFFSALMQWDNLQTFLKSLIRKKDEFLLIIWRSVAFHFCAILLM